MPLAPKCCTADLARALPHDGAPEEANVGGWSIVRMPSLVAKVLNPSTARQDRFQKKCLFQALEELFA